MHTHTQLSLAGMAALLTLAACGGGGGAGGADPVTPSSPPQASSPAPTQEKAMAAARNAAKTDPHCSVATLGDFYWEIGSASGSTPIVANAEGAGTVTADSHFNIASASKFLFGAFVLESKGIDAVRNDPALRDGLRFVSGYTGMNDDACVGKTTIGACFSAGMGGNTGAPNPATVGQFDYDSGHDQKLAALDLGMGATTAAQLSQAYQSRLGLRPDFTMAGLDPLMAGGMMGSASDYAPFLQSIMTGKLVIGAHLGENAVCTLPSACPGKVVYSPIVLLREPWTYSYNHWVESEHGNGTVDAYSSPGKWGFYPWISADRKYYGIVSRHDVNPGAYAASVLCGRQIRKAFLGAL